MCIASIIKQAGSKEEAWNRRNQFYGEGRRKASARVIDDKPEQQKTIEVTCFVKNTNILFRN
jgi:hypothetical protein